MCTRNDNSDEVDDYVFIAWFNGYENWDDVSWINFVCKSGLINNSNYETKDNGKIGELKKYIFTHV